MLKVGALGTCLAGGIGRDGFELGRKPRDEIGKLALTSTDLFQLLDQTGALAVAFVEKPAKGERQTTGWRSPDKVRAKAAIWVNPSSVDTRRGARPPNEAGDLGIGMPVAEVFRGWPIPVHRRRQLRDQPLLTGPIRIHRLRRRRARRDRSNERRRR